MTLMDDYSKKTWTYFLKVKSQVYQTFKYFKSMVEKETRDHIKIFQTNKGREYISLKFKRFCMDNGIIH